MKFDLGDKAVVIRTKKEHTVKAVFPAEGKADDYVALDGGTAYYWYELTTPEDFAKGGYKPGQFWRNGTTPEHELKYQALSRKDQHDYLLATTRASTSLSVGQKIGLENVISMLREREKAVPVAADPA
jgi:hypothetical protein